MLFPSRQSSVFSFSDWFGNLLSEPFRKYAQLQWAHCTCFLGLLLKLSQISGWKHRNLFFHSSRGQKSKLKVLQDTPPVGWRGKSISCPAPGDCRHSLACGCITQSLAPWSQGLHSVPVEPLSASLLSGLMTAFQAHWEDGRSMGTSLSLRSLT